MHTLNSNAKGKSFDELQNFQEYSEREKNVKKEKEVWASVGKSEREGERERKKKESKSKAN